jgi:DNA-binding FadR family transcriptional regulator
VIGVSFRVPKTAELVAQRLRRQIISGDLAEGDALPSETTLTETFGISRPTLREAFRVLEAEQLISVRRGARGGARVHAPSADVAARYAGFRLIRHHTEFHALIVRLADNHTVTLLSSMLRHIVDTANFRRVDFDAEGPVADRAFDHGLRAHRRLVTHIDQRDESAAESLWRKHLEEANDFLLDLPNTTILDLLE